MPKHTQSRSIFISYRREDAGGEAGRLFDDLSRTYGADTVFMDVAGIQLGIDFRTAVDDNISACGVLLAIIGRQWLTAKDAQGRRRLDNPNDFVRIEIATALELKKPVIPVLVQGALMPSAEELPDNLKDLAYRNGVELTLQRWSSDVPVLAAALRRHVSTDQEPNAHIPEPTAALNKPLFEFDSNNGVATSRLLRFLPVSQIAVIVAVVISVAIYFANRHAPPSNAALFSVVQTPAKQPSQETTNPSPVQEISNQIPSGNSGEKPSPTSSPKAAGPVRVSNGVMSGHLISKTEPIYPAIARAAHISGAVILHAIISRSGTVDNLSVVSGPEMLRSSSLEAVKTWRYTPYLVNGDPVEVETQITVNFNFDTTPATTKY